MNPLRGRGGGVPLLTYVVFCGFHFFLQVVFFAWLSLAYYNTKSVYLRAVASFCRNLKSLQKFWYQSVFSRRLL